MNLAFLLPAAFAALAALLIPLLIHLARRSEQRPTDFAALRWLRAKPRPRHRVRFDEWPLLLARLLLLAALALLLARPVLSGSAGHAPWVVVVPGVDLRSVRAMRTAPGTRMHWLAPGFPPLDAGVPRGSLPISSLLRELDASLPAKVPLAVLVPAQLAGVDAQRPVLGRRIDWRVMPGAMPPLRAIPVEAAPAMSIRHAPERAAGVRYLRAANEAWLLPSQSAAFDAAPLTQPLAANTRFLVWLAPGPLPVMVRDWIANGGVALLDSQTEFARPANAITVWRDDLGAPLVEGGMLGRGRILRLTRALSPQAMPQLLEPDFPARLRALSSTPPPPPARVSASAHAPSTGGEVFALPPRDLRSWLLWCIALLLLLERWLASSPRRGLSP